MNIGYHRDFKKDYKKLSNKLQEKFDEKLILFQKDQFEPILNNHALTGKYSGYRSINITGDLRALYKKDGEEIIFMIIDSHSNLYG